MINTSAAIRGNFHHRPKPGAAEESELPGRDLAELVEQGLRRVGFAIEGVVYEEPFFVVRCRVGQFEYELLSYLFDPHDVNPVWVVDCPSRLGFFDKWFARSKNAEYASVLQAIHRTLISDHRVREVRWFRSLPADPFSAEGYSRIPLSPH